MSEATPAADERPAPHPIMAEETVESMAAKADRYRRIVDQVPGAQVFREGMKVPGQEEREETEDEWLRGEWDPCGDGVVSGLRLERGEGRAAAEASGPTPGKHDDVLITLKGSPVDSTLEPFFTPRGTEPMLDSRAESRWTVELTDPHLSEHWANSLAGMSRGDLCRFTCAAKKSQAWLQSLARCCVAPAGSALGADGDGGGFGVPGASALQLPAGRLEVQPTNRAMVVEVRLEGWTAVEDVACKGAPPLYKRQVTPPARSEGRREPLGPQPADETAALTGDSVGELREKLRYAGEDVRKERYDGVAEDSDELRAERRRTPRPPDRVRLVFSLRRATADGWVTVGGAACERVRREFTLGMARRGGGAAGVAEAAQGTSGGGRGGGGGGPSEAMAGSPAAEPPPTPLHTPPALRVWPVLEAAACQLEEGEAATFTFGADEVYLPLGTPLCVGGLLGGGAPLTAGAGEAAAEGEVATQGEEMELEVSLESMLKQTDVSTSRDGTASKFKLATAPSGFWKPREGYSVTVSAAAAPPSAAPEAGLVSGLEGGEQPPGVSAYSFTLGAEGVSEALQGLVYTMSVGEVALLTCERRKLRPWPRGPLSRSMPAAASDGTLTLWVRLDAMVRVEHFSDTRLNDGGGRLTSGEVVKTTNNRDDVEWLEGQLMLGKGELPTLGEDVEMEIALTVADGAGKPLLAGERRLRFHCGDAPLCEDWMLQMIHTMYHGEDATVTATADHASSLLAALCTMLCPPAAGRSAEIDVPSACAHVARVGLSLHVLVTSQAPPHPRDGVSSAALLAAATDLKGRANTLFTAGYTAGAMRKYVRAAWLVQDGDVDEKPLAPMTEVVGVSKRPTGPAHDPAAPLRHRFEPSQAAALLDLRTSLHLNLAAGALKLGENYGALAAAQVARELAPGSVKPLYRLSQAHIALQDFTQAGEALSELLRIEPSNAAARKLMGQCKQHREEVARREKRAFGGMFSRAQKEGGPLFPAEEVERQRAAEKQKTKFVSDRAEEKRRGVEMVDVHQLAKLPEEYKQRQIDEMNLSIENDHKTSEIPAGLTEAQFRRLLQMRTDGDAEEKIEAEMRRMKREEMEKAREHMTPAEVERMAERQKAVEAARYKPEEVLAQREAEMWDEFAAIKLRVNRRIPLWDIEQRRAVIASREASDVLDDPTADEATKAGAMRKLLYDPFKDIDEQLTPEEKEELAEMKAHPDRIGKAEMERLQVLLNTATGRRIEQRVDELLQTEDDVLV